MARQRRKRESEEKREYVTADQVVADAVKYLRKRHGMTQQELADELGWPQSTIARVELGERSIGVSDLLALAWALDVAPGYLLAGSFQDEDVPVHQTLKVSPAHMLKWIRGGEPLPGLDYRRYSENVPDDEWIETRRISRAELVEQIAEYYERYETAVLEGELTEDQRKWLSAYEPERQAELLAEREQRRQQLAATRKAGKRKGA